MLFFIKGAVLGFLIAAPVGPIGLLCITRSLRYGWLTGFVSGLGAALADGIYAAAAIAGLAALIASAHISAPLHIAGAVFLVYLGVRAIRSAPPVRAGTTDATSLLGAFLSTVALTIVNPATIVSFASVFASAIGSHPLAMAAYIALVSGVVAGSCAWWVTLAGAVQIVRERLLRPATIERLNVWSGVLLIAFAIYSALPR